METIRGKNPDGWDQSFELSHGFHVGAVPELTRSTRIKLNERLSLQPQAKSIACRNRILPRSGPSIATPWGDYIPLGGLVSIGKPSMPTLREILQPTAGERRAVGRTLINRNVLMHYAGCDCVRACCVRDVTNSGAGIRLHGLNIVPSEFGISFDNFHTMRRCRLIWRDGDFVGVTFTA